MTLTKSQIKSKINEYEKLLKEHNDEKKYYKNSLSYSNSLISQLTSGNSYLEVANDSLKENFTINGKTADNGKIIKSKTNIANIIKKLNNEVIPDINYYISYLDNEIKNVQVEINKLWKDYNNAQE